MLESYGARSRSICLRYCRILFVGRAALTSPTTSSEESSLEPVAAYCRCSFCYPRGRRDGAVKRAALNPASRTQESPLGRFVGRAKVLRRPIARAQQFAPGRIRGA